MAGAPYEFNCTIPEDGTFLYSFTLKGENGEPFPWAEYEIRYSVGEGCSPMLSYEDGDDEITIDTSAGSIVVRYPASRLRRGRLPHKLVVTEIVSGDSFPQFDGYVTVTETPYR